MKIFRWSTAMLVLAYVRPYVIRMTGDMAADYAANVRKEAR
ncbi:MAG TPA: hypothetical protein VFX52_03765 [Nocardioidaceae bacterium]|nr:hypothetical protein [Nocardioidaceae bacterium]